ncbi:MAG TPA: ATP-binding protein, partial [Thermoanaerobaculia bacterium]|nr:ATP-binding protein [Thermoanaerobaculia bacterium]
RADLAALLPGLAPPPPTEMRALEAEARGHFERLDLAAMVPVDPATLDVQDLGFAIWRDSPLARRNALSAVSVLYADGRNSSFSFGLPLAAGTDVDRDPGRSQAVALVGWDELAVAGETALRAAGSPVATLRYWLFPRPGFRLGGREDEDLELALLRGGPAALGVEGLPPPARYALYTPDGRAVRVPWREAPPLAQALRRGGAAVVPTPEGRAWALAQVEKDGVEVIYLPLLGPRAALDRAGTHALATLLLLAAAALVAVLLGLPRSAFRDTLRRTLRSYSKRLILVYTLLLLVPLVLLNIVVARGLEERLRREQRAAGEAALASAQRVLGEYVLTLAPGFGIATALDDPLLVWLASVVHHDVSLYWGSSVYASSRRELFTAGLLPRRIPGEVYSRLALLGYGLAARTNRAGEVAYLELYAPVRVPGVPVEEEGLALSMPLLAQQAEVAAEISYLRRQALLGTAALFLLLVAVGTRFARSFTTPLMELVRGTQRIAAGARSLEVRPAEVELQALSEAIDRMAQGIAEGRERLVREKQVVERVVENITAGVVSLDAQGEVLMANRVAAELLGVRVGEPLRAVLAGAARLGPVAAFVAAAGREPRQATVRLPGADGEREWTLVWAPVPGSGEPSARLVVEDSTEVLRGQRLQAWAEMARIIAHEIKNPLTPIRLSAEHMRQVYGGDPERFGEVFERCTANILRQVDELRQIASEFSAYSHIPRLELVPGELVAAVAEVVESYRAAPPPGVEIDFHAASEPVAARFDAKLLGRAVRNLIENALRATAGGGRIEVRVEQSDAQARIVVADDGPGVPAEQLARIFDPYFSTHAAGTGLGLPIARRIAEEHGGRATARNRASGGLEVAITIPRA